MNHQEMANKPLNLLTELGLNVVRVSDCQWKVSWDNFSCKFTYYPIGGYLEWVAKADTALASIRARAIITALVDQGLISIQEETALLAVADTHEWQGLAGVLHALFANIKLDLTDCSLTMSRQKPSDTHSVITLQDIDNEEMEPILSKAGQRALEKVCQSWLSYIEDAQARLKRLAIEN